MENNFWENHFYKDEEASNERPRDSSSAFGQGGGPDDDFDQAEFDKLVIRDAKKTYSRVFGGLALYSALASVLMTLISVIAAIISPKAYDFLFGTMLGIYIMNSLILYAVCTPIFYFLVRKTEVRRLKREKIGFKEFFGVLAISQALMNIGDLIGRIFNGIIGTAIGRPVTNTTVEMIDSSSLWEMLIFTVILGPIFEELLMRKLVIDRLSKYGTGFAVIVSAVAFGLFHGNFYQFFYAAFLGLVLGYLYVKGGLKYSILLHMTINFLGSIVATLFIRAQHILINTEDLITAPVWAILMVYIYVTIVYGLIIYGIVLLIIKALRGEFRFSPFKDARLRIPEKSFSKCIFGNVGMILFLIVSTASMLFSILG